MKNTHLFYLYLLTLLIIAGCQKNDIDIPVVIPINEEASHFEDALMSTAKIGRAIPNPYKVEVLKSAIKNLQTKTKSNDYNVDIEATHHYVMFKPECHEHYKALIMDDELEQEINAFPLDHEISDGWFQTDPNPAYSTNGIQHRWAYVPVGKDLSTVNCPYEILYDICALDEETLTKNGALYDYLAVEQEAYRICNLKYDRLPETKASAVTPSGNIVYYDSSYGRNVGSFGLAVKAQRLTKKSYGACDDNGNFTCDKSFTYPWTYTVFFSGHDYEIRRGENGTDEIMLIFNSCHGPLNLTFNSSSSYEDCVFYCEISRACYKYFYGNIDGLHRPAMHTELNDRMYIQAMFGQDNQGNLGVFYRQPTLNSIPYIHIFRDSYNGRCTSREIYCTTCHELAHSAHWVQNPFFYCNSVETVVKESFATGIGWYLTKKVHPSFSCQYFGDYTGIIEDLIDDNGVFYSTYIPENVTGFSISEIEQAVQGAATWGQWRNRICTLFPYNPTIADVGDLFNLWNS